MIASPPLPVAEDPAANVDEPPAADAPVVRPAVIDTAPPAPLPAEPTNTLNAPPAPLAPFPLPWCYKLIYYVPRETAFITSAPQI